MIRVILYSVSIPLLLLLVGFFKMEENESGAVHHNKDGQLVDLKELTPECKPELVNKM